MSHALASAALPTSAERLRHGLVRRTCMALAVLAAAASLAACGGGEDPTVAFNIGVVVAGQPVSGVQIVPGAPQSLAIHAGQSIELDASEPVVWSLQVGGTSVTGSTTVYYAGASITQTTVSDSRIVVDTSAAYALQAPVPITFVATSTVDSAQVAVVNVLITN